MSIQCLLPIGSQDGDGVVCALMNVFDECFHRPRE